MVNSFQGYASRFYRPPARFQSVWKALYIQQAPPNDPRGGLVSPVEGGRWLVSLVGGDSYYPPTDDAGFLAFARAPAESGRLYEAIAGAEPLDSPSPASARPRTAGGTTTASRGSPRGSWPWGTPSSRSTRSTVRG